MINVNKLRGKIVENGMSVAEVAAIMGIDKSTLYRKMKSGTGETFTISEARSICEILNLSVEEATAIFFSNYVA